MPRKETTSTRIPELRLVAPPGSCRPREARPARPGSCARLWQAEACEDGRLGAEDELSFVTHALTCGACAAEVTALREVSRRLASLTEPARSELEQRRARRELIRRANEQIIGLDRPPSRWRLLAVVLLALCAGASIALGVRQAFRALSGPEAPRLAGE